MGTQQFCLKWNNHSSNMLNVFETLLTSEQLVDVTLACDGLSLKAHKMVLSACSPFFQSLFQENPCKHPIVILKDIRYTDLKAIIDFMYKGEVNVGQAHLSALLKTAETLKVKGLAEVSGEDGQSSSGSVVQQEVPVFPQAQHSSDVANIVQTIDNSIRPSSDSPTGRKRKRTKWKNRGQGNGNDSETDDQGPAAKNQEIVSADVIEDDSSSIGVVDGPSDTRNAKESRIIIEEATIVGDYVEPAALLEQNMTTDNVQPISSQLMLTNATSKDNEINVPENRSYDGTVATLTPETVDLIDRPEDVKPTALVSYEEPPMSPNATSSHHSQDDSNSMTMYMDPNSMPAIAGPSNYQQDKQPSASAGQGKNMLEPFQTQYLMPVIQQHVQVPCDKKLIHNMCLIQTGNNNQITKKETSIFPSYQPKKCIVTYEEDYSNPDIKPPFSYSNMISMAIEESKDKRLTLKEIYSYITTKFPYYAKLKKNWKNCVRHCLSLNSCFQKAPRDFHVGYNHFGSYWVLCPESERN